MLTYEGKDFILITSNVHEIGILPETDYPDITRMLGIFDKHEGKNAKSDDFIVAFITRENLANYSDDSLNYSNNLASYQVGISFLIQEEDMFMLNEYLANVVLFSGENYALKFRTHRNNMKAISLIMPILQKLDIAKTTKLPSDIREELSDICHKIRKSYQKINSELTKY